MRYRLRTLLIVATLASVGTLLVLAVWPLDSNPPNKRKGSIRSVEKLLIPTGLPPPPSGGVGVKGPFQGPVGPPPTIPVKILRREPRTSSPFSGEATSDSPHWSHAK